MRFHVLGIPHTVTSPEFNACAYTQKALKFCKMMTAREHEVFHYGHEESKVEAKHFTVVTNEDFKKSYGNHDWRKNFFKFDMGDHAYKEFFTNAISAIRSNMQPHDFVLPFWGSGTRPVCDALPECITVEPGIGYAGGHWARFKVFESYAIMHAYYGLEAVGQCKQDWYDVVIPNYFDRNDFTYRNEREDFFLFLGRCYDGKGLNIAVQAAKAANSLLVVAGQEGDAYFKDGVPDHVKYVGYADQATRRDLMSRAKGFFLPSAYLEPFGGTVIEAALSGCPVITTDWGAHPENVLHGKTGFRCRTFNDFRLAAQNISMIAPVDCLAWGQGYSLEAIAPVYEKYFTDVLNIYGKKGWYETYDDPDFFTRRPA